MTNANDHGATGHGSAADHGPAAAAHGATAGHGGGHDAHAEEPLGPIDLELWGAGLLGAAIAGFMAICFAVAAGAGAY